MGVRGADVFTGWLSPLRNPVWLSCNSHSFPVFQKCLWTSCAFHVYLRDAFSLVELGFFVLKCSNCWFLHRDKLLFIVPATGCFTRLAKSVCTASQLSRTANYTVGKCHFPPRYLFIYFIVITVVRTWSAGAMSMKSRTPWQTHDSNISF